MPSTRALYAEGLNNHLLLMEHQRNLDMLGSALIHYGSPVAGNEGLSEAMGDLGNGLLSVSKWVGGKTLSAFSSVLSSAGTALAKSFSDNKVLMERITQQLKSGEDHEYSLKESVVVALTCKGDVDDLSRDMDTLERHLELLTKHSSDILDYLDKQLLAAKKLRSISTTNDIFAAVDAFDAIKYPVFGLSHSKGDSRLSDVLPGGKVWEFDTSGNTVKYVIGGEVPSGAASSLTLDKSAVSTLLSKLAKVNAMHTRLKDAYTGYLSFLRSWSDMVKSVEPNLSKLDKVSRTAIGQAEKILAGDTQSLAFYSGFTPRVISYTDRYIHGVLGVFA